MSSSYQFNVYTPDGTQIAALDRIISASWSRKERQVGSFPLVVDPALVSPSLFALDGQIEVLRSVDGAPAYREGETRYLVRGVRRVLDDNGRRTLEVRCADGVDLLRRRIIAYAAGSSYTSKSGAADNLIKAFARENCGPSATDTARNYSAALWAVDTDLGAAASVEKAATRRNLLTVCQELADASAQVGTYLTFDVIFDGTRFRLATYTGQRGADRRLSGTNPLVLDPAFGTLGATSLDDDAREEATFIYAGGGGEGEAREVATATSSIRAGLSPFGRIEAFRQANTASGAALQDEADTALREARARRTFEAQFIDTPGVRFGVDVRFGDLVPAQFDGALLDCRLDGYQISIGDAGERVDVQLRSAT